MRATLTIELNYDDSTVENPDMVVDMLESAAEFLAAQGLLTGETPLVLDEYDYTVKLSGRNN